MRRKISIRKTIKILALMAAGASICKAIKSNKQEIEKLQNGLNNVADRTLQLEIYVKDNNS